MKASEALALSRKIEKREFFLKTTLKEIQAVASMGGVKMIAFDLPDVVLIDLKNLGYKVEKNPMSIGIQISWENAEEFEDENEEQDYLERGREMND